MRITIKQAIEQGIKQLRRDPWAPAGRITLPIFDDGTCGPWVTVEDGATDAGVLEPQKVIITMFPDDEQIWEPWKL